jgi:hypothetical protein
MAAGFKITIIRKKNQNNNKKKEKCVCVCVCVREREREKESREEIKKQEKPHGVVQHRSYNGHVPTVTHIQRHTIEVLFAPNGENLKNK